MKHKKTLDENFASYECLLLYPKAYYLEISCCRILCAWVLDLLVWIPLLLIAHKDIGHVVEGVSKSWLSLWLVCRFRTSPTLLSRFCWHFWFVWIQISLIWCWCRNLGQVRSWSYLATLLNKNIFCVENPYFMIKNAGYNGLPYTLRKKGA